MGMAQAARLNLRMQKELKLLLTDPPPGASFPTLSDGVDSSLTSIDALLQGPEGTVYSSGVFEIKIQIPERYPFQPPIVTFSTPIYHPNIDNGGRICLDILNLPPKPRGCAFPLFFEPLPYKDLHLDNTWKRKNLTCYHKQWKPKSRIEVACLSLLQVATDGMWQPSLNISTVLTSIGLLLTEPNPDDGLMHDASRDYKYNRQAFDQNARSMTEKYAQGMTDIARNGNSGQIHIGQSTAQIKIEGSVASACISEHRKLSLESPGCSNNRRNGEEEISKAPAQNSSMNNFEIGLRKEASKDSSKCTVNFGKLHATRYELSPEVSVVSDSRNGKSENTNLSNQSSSQTSSDFSEPSVRASIRDEDHVERSHSTSVSKGLQSFRVRTKLSRVSNEKSQNIIQHTGSPLDSVRPQELSLNINHNKTNPPKDTIASKGNCSTSIKLKKTGSVALKPSSELYLSDDKENLAPLRCLLPQLTDQAVALSMTSESDTCCNKTEGMEAIVAHMPFEPSVKIPLKSLYQQVGSNNNVILHDVRSGEKQHVVQVSDGESANALKQLAEGSQAQAPDAVIVLDSEDSDEENVPVRSKLMLTRRCLSRKRKLGL